MTKEQTIKELTVIHGIGKSLATDLWNIGITSIEDLKGKDPEVLFTLSNDYAGVVQDRCVCMLSDVRFISRRHHRSIGKRKN